MAHEELHKHTHEHECGDHEHSHGHDHCGCHEHGHGHGHGDGCGCGHDHDHHDADEVFTSWGSATAKKYTSALIGDILDKFSESNDYGMILRAKGIVEGENGEWIHFDYVPGEPDIRSGSADVTGKICVIGSSLNEKLLCDAFGVEDYERS